MEEILNHLILMDDGCKNVLKDLQEKKENIEYFVNHELGKRKDEIKTKYKFKMDMKQNDYDMKLAEAIKNMEAEKNQEIEEIQNKYAEDKSNLMNAVIESILNERKNECKFPR